MKIAFPIKEDEGLESTVFGHFGSAPLFIIMDSEKDSFDSVINQDKDHQHGQCQPLAALENRPVDAVVVGGIGAGALNKLNAAGIKTYRAIEGTVLENIKLIKSGALPVFTLDQTCAGHGSNGNCIH
ncbi:NifB/NifX family molybdenum-iron cluster-binding protein [Thermodesulfobacteriota bacterium]